MQRLILIIVACLALFVGCGDDSSTTETGGGGSTTAAQSKRSKEEAAVKKEEEKAAEEVAALPKPKIPSGRLPKKLVIVDRKTGSGATAKAGDEVSVRYVGILYKSKELFDANWNGDEPFTFELGAGEVIKGWDQGVQGMKAGGQRELFIPPSLAYGPEGIYPSIPPNSTLAFLVELLKVK
ncbi:MAG TPA: FKBP-type peptidyl-prolyl cis-trans isomerase [Solirubrobacterales bacterium]|nr:FKBP-type peptidyl-prolyl cis-trans isomerase [Solirubrobacterales bacterium]